MIPITDLDYVKLYAERLKKDKSLFKQQKKLIESQMKSSSELAKKMFGENDFKLNARKYLRKLNLL
ncbi:hypothetical protein CMI46_01850 [Candidatus Pacearchaeota archaeon]|nr:hypothetical protein [Candidatus Pacearchaeota archaeon]|tara:strand:- start:2437 stop:2634 length:198 start_codon:yes stop_codon:yes gene_type:complete